MNRKNNDQFIEGNPLHTMNSDCKKKKKKSNPKYCFYNPCFIFVDMQKAPIPGNLYDGAIVNKGCKKKRKKNYSLSIDAILSTDDMPGAPNTTKYLYN